MLKNIILILVCFTLFCCKKKKDTSEESTPTPKPTSSINIYVVSYDSLGSIDNNNNLIPVSFYQTSFSATTNTAGIAVFNNLPYDTYIPIINKIGYDVAPLGLTLNSTNILTAILPLAKQSPYKMDTLIGQNFNKDSITLTFNLSKTIPAGKTVRLAVITGTNNGLNPNDFVSVDIVNLSSPNVVKLNVAKLSNFANAVAALATNTNFYVNAIPISYGPYYSNILYKSVLLGDNLYYRNNLIFLKNW